MSTLTERITGAMKLDPAVYEDVEHDVTATGQAAIVVVLATVASSLWFLTFVGPNGLLFRCIAGLLGWVVGAFFVWLVGTKILPAPNTRADIAEVMRVSGFAQAPALINIIAFLPVVGGLIRFITGLWVIAATVVAIRQALDFDSTLRAVIVAVLAIVLQYAAIAIIVRMTVGALVF
jgi:hypothetical protein